MTSGTGSPRGLLLGCIADDFTGATDLANNLVRAGMRVVQTIGVPTEALDVEVDAVVVALKSRTIAPDEAVAQSLRALGWLRSEGARQIYFKVCSTFDSRFSGEVRGNIGPVTEALMDALAEDLCVVTPAFPDNGRTVFKGYLFVGDVLLSESGMRNHPLTPMTDANLVRVMQAQCRRRVGLIDHRAVADGTEAVLRRIAAMRTGGVGIAIADAVSNEDLMRLGPALADRSLIVAGSGVAIALPANHGLGPNAAAEALPPAQGLRAVVSGSCSEATHRQVTCFTGLGGAAFALDPLRLAAGEDVVDEALRWAETRLPQGQVLVYSTAPPGHVRDVQDRLGTEAAGALVERALAAVARGLVERGVGQLVVAGGETSGACVQALGVTRLQIGPQIDPGVPWCHAHAQIGGRTLPLHLALKSGNFGADDFFIRAFDCLPG